MNVCLPDLPAIPVASVAPRTPMQPTNTAAPDEPGSNGGPPVRRHRFNRYGRAPRQRFPLVGQITKSKLRSVSPV
jgi:hypothetical protein